MRLTISRYLQAAFAFAVLLASCDRKPSAEAPGAPGSKTTHQTYSLQWVSNDVPSTMPANKSTAVHVSVKNTGDWAWPNPSAANPPKPDGSYAVRLSYRWADATGKLLPQGAERGELSASVPAGETANFSMEILAPKDPGSYQLQLDLVEELVSFFSAKGAQKLIVPVTVVQ